MKKTIIALSTIFCTILIMVSIYSFIPRQGENTPSDEAVQKYVITDYSGKVAVFIKDENEPMVVYEVYTHLLPENDIEILRKGIEVDGLSELQVRLEDFGL